jgi:Zn-dependent alcohol dehydrogenase
VKHPKSLSFVEAASIWMMFLTAYGALIEDAKVTKGDFVIIPGASSSVGLAAIQIANYAGATSIALTRTSEKRKQLLEAGTVHVIPTGSYTTPTGYTLPCNDKDSASSFEPDRTVAEAGHPSLASARPPATAHRRIGTPVHL